MAARPRNIPARSLPTHLGLLLCGLAGTVGVLTGQAGAQVRVEAVEEAEPETARPSGAQRLVRRFDFDESDFNPLPIPMGWVRAQHDPSVPRVRPGFPIWNQAELDSKAPSISGSTTLRIPVEGGSASLRLLPGAIGVFPGTDYLVSAKVRTAGMVHARACVAARLLDEQGHPIPGSESVSRAVRTTGEWVGINAAVAGLDERAAFLQIELLVLQPKQLPGADTDRPFAVWSEDFHANAWFDDVEVTLLPRIELETGVPGHAFTPAQTPEISMLVRDLTGETLSGVLRVLDADRRIVSEQELRSSSGRLSETRVPTLPGPGWYRAVLDVSSNSGVVGRGILDFVWGAPGDERQLTDGVFALSVDATDPTEALALPAMAAWANVSSVTVGVWEEAMTEEAAALDVNPAYDAVRGVLNKGIDATIRTGETPGDLADLAGRDSWDVPGVIGSDESIWMPWLEGALDRFGQGVLSWQLGDHPLYTDAEALAAHVDLAYATFNRWIPGPELRSPWPLGDPFDPALVGPGRGVVITDDGAGDDHTLAERVRSWVEASPSPDDGGLTIEFPVGEASASGTPGLGRLARRALNAWVEAHNTGITDRFELAIREPWRSSGGRRPSMMPAPELALWRTLASVLEDRGTVRELDLLPGVRAILVGDSDDALLIAWLTDPEAPSRSIDLPFGDGGHGQDVRQISLQGVRTPLTPTQDPRWGSMVYHVPLSREPVIIDGVDAPYFALLASVRLDPERMDPILGERTHDLVIDNPFPVPVRGKVFIVEPGGLSEGVSGRDRSWQVTPRVVPFVVDAFGTTRVPIEILFGAAQRTGHIPAVFDVQVSSDRDYPTARVARWASIDSEQITVEATAVRSGDDVVVRAFVTNLGEGTRSADLVAFAPGAPRVRAQIRGITEGVTMERRFILEGVPRGQSISVSLIEPTTGERLLRVIEID